jgi:hypothetical protein
VWTDFYKSAKGDSCHSTRIGKHFKPPHLEVEHPRREDLEREAPNLKSVEKVGKGKGIAKPDEEEEDTEAAKTEAKDWVDYLGPEAMQLFNQDGDVLALIDEEAAEEELATMITPADEITSSWIFNDPDSVVPNIE